MSLSLIARSLVVALISSIALLAAPAHAADHNWPVTSNEVSVGDRIILLGTPYFYVTGEYFSDSDCLTSSGSPQSATPSPTGDAVVTVPVGTRAFKIWSFWPGAGAEQCLTVKESLSTITDFTITLPNPAKVGTEASVVVTTGTGISSTVRWGRLSNNTCLPISGAIGSTYTPTPDVVDQGVCFLVAMSGAGYSDREFSAIVGYGSYSPGGMVPPKLRVTPDAAPLVGVPTTITAGLSGLPAGAAAVITWGTTVLDDGDPYCGTSAVRGTGSTYVPKTVDLGSDLCAVVKYTAPGYATVDRDVILGAVAENTTPPVTDVPHVTVSDLSIRKGQTFTVRAYGLKPNQAYAIRIKGRQYTGRADEAGRVVRDISYPRGTKSSKKRFVHVYGWSGSRITYHQLVKVTYKR